MKFAHLEQDAKRSFIFSITGDEPSVVSADDNRIAEEENIVKKRELKALKDDIENMQVKAVETARSNSKSESLFLNHRRYPAMLLSTLVSLSVTSPKLMSVQPADE